jgi:hypothetical protein
MTPQIHPAAGTLPWLGVVAVVAVLIFVAVIAYALCKSAAVQEELRQRDIDQGESFGGEYE